MNKSMWKLLLRKIAKSLPQMLSIALLIIIGTAFFITLSTIVLRFEKTTVDYMRDYAYADLTAYGSFDDNSVAKVAEFENVIAAKGRYVADFRDNERVVRAISLTEGINLPYFREGTMPTDDLECLILERNAKAWNQGIGSSLAVGGRRLKITGIVNSPEHIYLVKDARVPVADAEKFGIVFTRKEFFVGNYQEIVILGDSVDNKELAKRIAANRINPKQSQHNYEEFREDLKMFDVFSLVFPLFFAVLIVAVIYVGLKRTVLKDRKQIGIYKALGLGDGKIIGFYVLQYSLVVLIASLVGGGIAALITNSVIGLFSSHFVVPTLSFAFYPHIWAIAVGVSLLTCILSALPALLGILKTLPADAMCDRASKSAKRILLERTPLWKKLSFHTRYSVKSALRNKGRFFVSVLGMFGACALLVFALGFKDSINHMQNLYFDHFANYNITASFDPLPMTADYPLVQKADKADRALQFHTEIQGQECLVTIVEKDFDMLNIPTERLSEGIAIPEYFAKQWKVKTGDSVIMNGKSVRICATVRQTLALSVYADRVYCQSLGLEIPPVYNTVFVRSQNWMEIAEDLKQNNAVYSTLSEDRITFALGLEFITKLVNIMLIFAVVLGLTVLYSVGLINLAARAYEYMFLGVMGYTKGKIAFANWKELLMQFVLAVPLGLLFGRIFITLIQGAFSSNTFVIAPAVYAMSYCLPVLAVLAMSALMVLITLRKTAKMNLVEGLKAEY